MSVDSEVVLIGEQQGRHRPAFAIAWMAAFGVLIMGVCWASIILPREMDRVPAFWPANAITLTAASSQASAAPFYH